MELNNYDHTAGFYDFLSRLVFFRSQVKAQTDQLLHLPFGSKILIVGGGTGWILEEINKIHPAGLDITFVEISEQMMKKAMMRDIAQNQVKFIRSGIESFNPAETFTVILTAFLFDNFRSDRINKVFNQLDDMLIPGGLWFFTDFKDDARPNKFWQQIILKMMYAFFRKLSNVEATELTDMEPYFQAKNYEIIRQQYYYGDFITAIIFQKPAKIHTFIQNLKP